MTTAQALPNNDGANDEPESSPLNLGDMIRRAAEIRDLRRDLSKRDTELREEFDLLEKGFIELLDEQGTTMSGGGGYTISISEQVVPTVQDWDAVHAWAKDNDALYILERRIASTAWREMYQAGQTLPGTEPFTKRGINLRKSG